MINPFGLSLLCQPAMPPDLDLIYACVHMYKY
jgi:hypothetical protein